LMDSTEKGIIICFITEVEYDFLSVFKFHCSLSFIIYLFSEPVYFHWVESSTSWKITISVVFVVLLWS
jgi:hypothetical protein